MPISDYANAFFFAHPTRVALEGKPRVRFSDSGILLCEALRLHLPQRRRVGSCRPHRRNAEARNLVAENAAQKTKARLKAGLLQLLVFGLAHFASLAI